MSVCLTGKRGEVTWNGRVTARLRHSWSVWRRCVGTCEWSRSRFSLVSLREDGARLSEVVRRLSLFMHKCSRGGPLKTHVWPRDFCSDFPLVLQGPLALLSLAPMCPPPLSPSSTPLAPILLCFVLKAHSSPLGSLCPSLSHLPWFFGDAFTFAQMLFLLCF